MGRETQLVEVYKAFYHVPMTMKECEVVTGVDRANICRYCGTLRKTNKVYKIRQRLCTETNDTAWELTTNPDLAPPQSQLTLF